MTILRVGNTSKLHLKRQRVIVNDLMHKNYVYLLTEPREAEAIMLGACWHVCACSKQKGYQVNHWSMYSKHYHSELAQPWRRKPN